MLKIAAKRWRRGMEPRLSVITPAWNSESTIEAALASVLIETGVPLECIVVDDASSDGTTAVVEAVAARDPRVRLLRTRENAGVSAARNRALDVARGTWLAFLDADDRLLPGGLGAMMRAGEDRDALAVVAQRISTDGERTWVPKPYDWPDIREPGRKSIVGNPHLLYYAGPAGKLFHRSCTEGLRFEGRMLGDQPWVISALLRAGDAIEVITDVVYEWRRPHPDHYIATITSARMRSAAVATTAVGLAGEDYRMVMAEVDRTAAADARQVIAVTYLERLIQADLQAALARAVKANDPELPGLLGAMASFLETIPPEVRRRTPVVAVSVIAPPLRSFRSLAPAAQRAFLALVRAALLADAGVLNAIHGRGVRRAVRVASALPPSLGAPLLGLAMLGEGAVRRMRRRGVAS
jgi:hypothetical protein